MNILDASLTVRSKFDDARDADDAMYNMNQVRFGGRELEIEFARGGRKSESIPKDLKWMIYVRIYCQGCIYVDSHHNLWLNFDQLRIKTSN